MIKKFEKMGLKYKFTWVFIVSTGFLLLTTLFFLQQTVKIYNDQLYESLKISTQMATSIGDQYVEDIVQDSYEILTDGEFQRLFLDMNRSKGYEAYELNEKISNKLYNYLFNTGVLSIHIFFNNMQTAAVTKDIYRLPPSLIQEVRQGAMDLQGEIFWMEPSDKTEGNIILARQVRLIENLSLEPLGIIIFRINPEEVVQKATHDELKNNVLLLSGQHFIYHGESIIPFASAKAEPENMNGYSIKVIQKHKYFFVYSKSKFKDWVYASYISYDKLFKSNIIITRIYILLYLGIGLVIIYIINRAVRSLLKPVEKLTFRMRKVENGNFHQEAEVEYLNELKEGNEIDRLEYDFHLMIDKINHLIDENYIKQLQMKKFQIKALQAQINPHFLYNTLNSIFWLAKVNDQKDIAIMIKSLANLMRKSIDERNQMMSIKDELMLLKDYINIQKIRHKDRLQIKMDIDESLEGYQIPKLTLQPLVENAINYGLEKEVRDCMITITGYEKDKMIYLVVEDNGSGMSKERVRDLNLGLIKPKGTGIGVKNIKERLHNVFEGKSEMKFESILGNGTEVTIKIPKVKMKIEGSTSD